jgi:hypothetical protein
MSWERTKRANPGQELTRFWAVAATLTPIRYDGAHVTVRLAPFRRRDGDSVDDYYRLNARWEGGTLLMEMPRDHWSEVATFVHGRFEVKQSGVVWVYERVRPDQLDESHRPLEMKREPYAYPVQPRRLPLTNSVPPPPPPPDPARDNPARSPRGVQPPPA